MKKVNILIVEDEGITALFLDETLSSLQHDVKNCFDNAQEVLDFLNKDSNIDLIFMDINIKGSLDGISLAKEIKIKYPKIAFVFVTSYKDSMTISEAKYIKPYGYLIKPVLQSDIEAMMMVVDSHIGNDVDLKSIDKNIIKISNYTYNLENNILYKDEIPIALSLNETKCIEILFKNKNSYVSIEQLLQTIWNTEKDISSLRELVYRLRKKLPNLKINSTPNLGYIVIDS